MYKKIEAEIILLSLSKKEVANKLGIAYNTLLAKLRGESSFTLDEAFALKKVLNSNMDIEILFEKNK